MRHLSEIKGTDAVELIGDILVPMTDIMSDPDIQSVYENGRNVEVVQYVMKHHAESVLMVMALIEGVDPEEYNPSLLDIPLKLMAVINDPIIQQLFRSQAQSMVDAPSGSVTENTGAIEAE